MSVQKKFEKIIWKSDFLCKLLKESEEINLPHWYIGAGCVTQTVWNFYHQYRPEKNINDIDLIYFDHLDLSEKSEKSIQDRVRKKFKHTHIEVDVVNQARVHLWYEKEFGFPIKPYTSSENAIDSWPTTASSLGIASVQGELNIYSPFGLDDLMQMKIRANKTLINEKIFYNKANKWKKNWPMLKIIDW